VNIAKFGRERKSGGDYMRYQTNRNLAIGLKIIGWIILLLGLTFYGGSIGAGVYNHDYDQLGGGIQLMAISIGIGIGFLIAGSISDKIADDKKHEQLMQKLEEKKGRNL